MLNTKTAELEALWASVEHWLDNWQTVVRIGSLPPDCIDSNACPLCRLHVYSESKGTAWTDCSKCVIQRNTGKTGCNATPWNSVDSAIFAMLRGETNADALERAILEEYQFLVGLALQESQAL